MSSELFFRAAFAILLLVFLISVACMRYLTRRSAEQSSSDRKGQHSRMRIVAVALFAPLWWGGIILYVVLPSRIGFLSIPLPNWFRLIMVCVAALGMSFALWAFRTLGRNWVHALEAPQFVRRKDNVLVTNGPYHYVRNPIYLGAFTFILAVTLVAANWLLVLPALALVTIIYMQIGKEEKMLIDRFGDEYREYMKRTPRFIPKLGSRR